MTERQGKGEVGYIIYSLLDYLTAPPQRTITPLHSTTSSSA